MGEHCAVNEWSLHELAAELLASAKEVSAEFGPWPDFEAAAERASRELAAKDAEIAELRELAAERSECADQAGDVAAEAIAAQRKAESERDEARECVKRLAQGLRNAASNSYGPDRAEALAVLAATPEHLRGAV